MSGPVNCLKAALASGEPQLDLWLSAASPVAAQAAGASGFHWCLIDGEHGPGRPMSSRRSVARWRLGARAPWLGVPVGADWAIKQALDMGARTLLVPMVGTGAQAQQVVRATRCAPEGVRGLGANVARVSGWGRMGDYATTANEQIGVLVQAETRAAIENLDDILAVAGTDCIFIGPADLSADMGYRGNPGAWEVQPVIANAAVRIRAAGKAAGIIHHDPARYPRCIDFGLNFLGVGADFSVMRTGDAATLAAARAATKTVRRAAFGGLSISHQGRASGARGRPRQAPLRRASFPERPPRRLLSRPARSASPSMIARRSSLLSAPQAAISSRVR